MPKSIFILLFVLALFSSGCKVPTKQCVPNRYAENEFVRKDWITTLYNIPYKTITGTAGIKKDLLLDVTLPSQDNGAPRPLIILIHGGGFYAGNKDWMDSTRYYLAQRGFVVASIEYRLIWHPDTSNECIGDTAELKKGIKMAIEDGFSAIKYFIGLHDYTIQEFDIDTGQIFIAGSSAGAITALAMAYASPPDGFNYHIKGVAAMWGAMLDTNLITKNSIPAMLMHGTNDKVLSYSSGIYLGCDTSSHYPIIYGSRSIANRMKHLGICYELDSVPGEGHGVYDYQYRVQHIACFFKSIMCGSCSCVEIQNEPAKCR